MHHDNVRNINTKYETLCNITSKDEVWDAVNNCHMTLESILMKVNYENHLLFLAVE